MRGRAYVAIREMRVRQREDDLGNSIGKSRSNGHCESDKPILMVFELWILFYLVSTPVHTLPISLPAFSFHTCSMVENHI